MLIHKEVSLIFRRLKVVCLLPPPNNFEPSENQAKKKWKRMFTPPHPPRFIDQSKPIDAN